VQVVVLTNSLSATDVAVVHSGYAKYRRELLAGGVQLWELKRASSAPATGGASAFAIDGSSSASLHAKTSVADCSRIFVGSFNFDPRSARLNSEMGVTLQAPELAKTMCDRLQAELPARAYRVNLRPDGELEWWEDLPEGRKVWTEEPLTSAWQRMLLVVLSWLPVEWLL
jgi:putative cardiolipin synthase